MQTWTNVFWRDTRHYVLYVRTVGQNPYVIEIQMFWMKNNVYYWMLWIVITLFLRCNPELNPILNQFIDWLIGRSLATNVTKHWTQTKRITDSQTKVFYCFRDLLFLLLIYCFYYFNAFFLQKKNSLIFWIKNLFFFCSIECKFYFIPLFSGNFWKLPKTFQKVSMQQYSQIKLTILVFERSKYFYKIEFINIELSWSRKFFKGHFLI